MKKSEQLQHRSTRFRGGPPHRLKAFFGSDPATLTPCSAMSAAVAAAAWMTPAPPRTKVGPHRPCRTFVCICVAFAPCKLMLKSKRQNSSQAKLAPALGSNAAKAAAPRTGVTQQRARNQACRRAGFCRCCRSQGRRVSARNNRESNHCRPQLPAQTLCPLFAPCIIHPFGLQSRLPCPISPLQRC
jgi:hypothetical protein